jgi:hypothetical protein
VLLACHCRNLNRKFLSHDSRHYDILHHTQNNSKQCGIQLKHSMMSVNFKSIMLCGVMMGVVMLLNVIMFLGAVVVEFPGDQIFNHLDKVAVRFCHSGQILGSP